jgi:hypothetical protein
MYIQLDGNVGNIFFTSYFHCLKELTKCLLSLEKHQVPDYQAQIVVPELNSTPENG